jgi:hypothetical protein
MDGRKLESQMFLTSEFVRCHHDNLSIEFYDLLRTVDLVATKNHCQMYMEEREGEKYIYREKITRLG